MKLSSRQCLPNVSNINQPLVILLLHILSVASSLSPKQQQLSTCHGDDRAALLQFKQSLTIDPSASGDHDSYPKILSWHVAEENQSSNCCSWDGVTCDDDTGHVIGLDLSSSCLYGSINTSSSLFRLVHLRALNLADNNFNRSHIPMTIRKLSGLRYLNLSFSVFSGQVPFGISQLSKLSSLDLSGNVDTLSNQGMLKLKEPNLAGLVQNLTSLEKLHLSYISISSTIPHSLVNLSILSSLSLENCDLYGEFPIAILKLQHLKFLRLKSNEQLSGYLPNFNGSSPLQGLSLRVTNFSGTLPTSIGELRALKALDLANCSFSGPLPASLANLTNLNSLILRVNNFVEGSMSWLGRQTRLEALDLQGTNLKGHIPSSLGNLTQLIYVSLYDNKLTGPIPSSLGNLSRLNYLHLDSNKLTGTIPESLLNLNQLIQLNLLINQLHGNLDLCKLPSSLTMLQTGWNKLEVSQCRVTNTSLVPKLQVLGLPLCNIKEVPDFLRHQQHLTWLDISRNKLHGEIPNWMWNISTNSLQFLELSSNSLSSFGQTHVELPWINLRVLFLYNNSLHGSPPIPARNIAFYSVSDNKFTGELSSLMCKLTSLQYLDLANNKLNGTIPSCLLGNFSDALQVLVLRNNSFRGVVPDTFSNKSQLKTLDVSYNQLHGEVPRSLGKCSMLESLVLSVNKFSDVFPIWLGNLPQLKLLGLHDNEFYGVIENSEKSTRLVTHSVTFFPELRILDISYNNFRGEFPSKSVFSGNAMRGIVLRKPSYMLASSNLDVANGPKFGYYFVVTITSKGVERYYDLIQEDLGVIDISSNNFHGEIPDFIGNLKGLRFLNISNNNFNGSIPSVMKNLSLLESLDLSDNELSGEIPQELSELTSLAYFDVSYNNLEGSIPQGSQLGTFENSSFEGNPRLCGKPLTKRCGDYDHEAQVPPSSSVEESESSGFEFEWRFVLAGVGSGLVVGVVLSDVVITRKRELFLDVVGMMIRQIKRISRQLRR